MLVSLRSGPITAVKFASEGIVASSSTDGITKFWDLGTGQDEKTAEAVPEGFTFPKEGGARDGGSTATSSQPRANFSDPQGS